MARVNYSGEKRRKELEKQKKKEEKKQRKLANQAAGINTDAEDAEGDGTAEGEADAGEESTAPKSDDNA